MPHIDLSQDLPGIAGLLAYRPETAAPLGGLAEVLLRSDNSLTRGERELIAAHVSHLNRCTYCEMSHSAFAAHQLEGGWDLVDATLEDLDSAPLGDKMKALLVIAGQVQRGGGCVTDRDVRAARDAGASDVEIHDTVLIAAAFCMFNRYVDGLGTWTPTDREAFEGAAERILSEGYDTHGKEPGV